MNKRSERKIVSDENGIFTIRKKIVRSLQKSKS